MHRVHETTRFPGRPPVELDSIAVLVTQQELQGHLPRFAHGHVGARRHHHLAELELAGSPKLLDQDAETGLENGERAWGWIALPDLARA